MPGREPHVVHVTRRPRLDQAPAQAPKATALLLGADGGGAWVVDRVPSKTGRVNVWRVND